MATVIRGDDNFDTAFAKSVAIIADVKAHNVHGGTFTQDAWRTRDLNTELDDPSNIVTIASNQFTLQAGTYLVEWSCPAYKCENHGTRLRNITDSTTEGEGSSMFAYVTYSVNNNSVGASVVTISSSKTFEVQHYCDTTKTNNGFGLYRNEVSGDNSVYTIVKIHKIGA